MATAIVGEVEVREAAHCETPQGISRNTPVESLPEQPLAAHGDAYVRRRTEIDFDMRFTREAKQLMKQEAEHKARPQLEALFEKHHREPVLREILKEEGASRAKLRSDPAVLDILATDNDRAKLQFRQQHEANTLKRVDLDLRDLDAASDLQKVADLFDEAEAAGGEVMRRVGKHAIRRATALLSATRRETASGPFSMPDSPDRRLVADLRGRDEAWTKANPTPAQRLRRTLEQKALRESQLASQRERWLIAYGL